MKKIVIFSFLTAAFASQKMVAKKSGTAWIHIWNNTPAVLGVWYHTGKNRTEQPYIKRLKVRENRASPRKYYKGFRILKRRGHDILVSWKPGPFLNPKASIKEKCEANVRNRKQQRIHGQPRGIIFKNMGKRYYLSHRDRQGKKYVASFGRWVEIQKDPETGGLRERWYFLAGRGAWNKIPQLKNSDLAEY